MLLCDPVVTLTAAELLPLLTVLVERVKLIPLSIVLQELGVLPVHCSKSPLATLAITGNEPSNKAVLSSLFLYFPCNIVVPIFILNEEYTLH